MATEPIVQPIVQVVRLRMKRARRFGPTRSPGIVLSRSWVKTLLFWLAIWWPWLLRTFSLKRSCGVGCSCQLSF